LVFDIIVIEKPADKFYFIYLHADYCT